MGAVSRVLTPFALVVLLGAGCLSITPEAAETAPLPVTSFSLSEGLVTFEFPGPGTMAIWADVDGQFYERNDQYNYVMAVRTFGPWTPSFVSLAHEMEDGSLASKGWGAGIGDSTKYFAGFGPLPAPERLLIILAAETEGPWLIQAGLVKEPLPQPPEEPPENIVRPHGFIGPPPQIAVHYPSFDKSHGVHIEDTRGDPVLGSYTSGHLRYTIDLASTVNPTMFFAHTLCAHEGEGEFTFSAHTDNLWEDSAIYNRAQAGTYTLVSETASEARIDLTFWPKLDAKTTCNLTAARIPLQAAGIDAQMAPQPPTCHPPCARPNVDPFPPHG